MTLPVRPDLVGRTPYGAPQLDAAVRLNTNENSHPLPAALLADIATAVRAAVPELNRYPDREAVALRTDLAGYLGGGVGVEQVWAANGSNEILQQLLQAFGGPDRVALGFTPSYSMHPVISTGTGTRFVDGGRSEEFALGREHAVERTAAVRPDVVFLCSPNNPTGGALDPDVVAAVYDATEGIVVVDEAYAEFARAGTPSALALLPGRPRLVVTRTMSKAFGMAGLRLGYLVADPAVVDAIRLVRLPYHLSTLTQVAARAALAHAPALLATVAAVMAQRDRIVAALPSYGLRALPSEANFVLFGGMPDAAELWRALLTHGVLVRDVGVPGWLRVTAGTEAETSAFLTALAAIRFR